MIDSVEISPPDESAHPLREFARRILSQPWLPVLLAALFVVLDIFSGPFLQFPVTFVIPVAIAAWFGSLRKAGILAVAQPTVNFAINVMLGTGIPGMPIPVMAVNSTIRVGVLLVLAYFIHRSARQNRELARRVGLLRPSIPICFSCKKVQDENREWTALDLYICRHTGARFDHSVCPSCRAELHSVPQTK